MKRDGRIAGIRRWLELPLSRRRIEREVEDEIRFHIESRTAELVGQGMPATEARQQALTEFGDLLSARRELTEVDRRRAARWKLTERFDRLGQDLRYALRGIAKRPGFAAVVVVTLALGIGANATMFGIVDRMLLQPPPHVATPDRVVQLFWERPSDDGRKIDQVPTRSSYPWLAAIDTTVPSLAGLAGYSSATFTLGRGVDAREIAVVQATGNYFSILGVRAVIGRVFGPDEDRAPDGEPVAVISHRYWTREFDRSHSALGQTLLIAGKTFTIIGVAPRAFTGVGMENVDAWVPLSALADRGFIGEGWRTNAGSFWIQAVGKLAPDATVQRAGAEITLAHQRIARIPRPRFDTAWSVVASPVTTSLGPAGAQRDDKISIALVIVSAIVLLIACANIANLLLARSMQRRQEIAVRLALGAAGGRLAVQVMLETLVLATLAAVAALAITHWSGQVVRAVLFPQVAWDGSPVNARVLALAAAVTFVTALAAGGMPALRAARTDPAATLKATGRAGGGRRARARSTLLVTQAALSVILVIGAGLFVRSLHNMRSLDVGIDLDRTTLVTAELSSVGFESPMIRDIYHRAAERIGALPGVESVSPVSGTVPMRIGVAGGFRIPGRDSLPNLPGGGPYLTRGGANLFETLGARVVHGRWMTGAEANTAAPVAAVNEMLARHYWPGESPVGRCVLFGRDSTCTTIIGVVQDVALFQLAGEERALVYRPLTEASTPFALLVRLSDRGSPALATIRREMQALSANMPYVFVKRYGEVVQDQYRPWRTGATLFGIFGGLAVLIAAIGLYSVISYGVTQRSHEIGVRLALGARPQRIVRMVLRDGVRLALIGVGIGIALALAASRWVGPLLFEVSPRDPLVIAAVAVLLTVVAVAASLLPGMKASEVDPAVTLRTE